MGGFLLFNTEHVSLNNSLNIFKMKKLNISKEINFLNFKLITFHKRSFNNTNFFSFGNENFIASLGTPIYKKLSGVDAASVLYYDFKKSNILDFANFSGNFCYIIFIDYKVYLFNDFNGSYHIYHDVDYNIISNSFLVISNHLSKKDISSQGLYEYIFYGATFGSDCIVKDIKQLSFKKIVQLNPEISLINKEYSIKNEDYNQNFNILIDNVAENLLDYFKTVTQNYQEFTLGLSGGFDSRLILSALLKCDIKPFVCTSGSPGSVDVKISKEICKSFGLEFENFYENEEFFEIETLSEIINENFILDDGFNYFGVFFPFLDMDLKNSQRTKLILSGIGGELYRDRWNLPNKNISISDFINARFKNFSERMGTAKFNEKKFLKNMEEKIVDNLGLERYQKKLTPALTNLIDPNFKMRYLAGRTITKINQFCFVLLPFSEPRLYSQSIHIPLKYKIAGKFEAALIKKINPEIAKHNSSHGFNFYKGPTFIRTVKEWSKIYTPISFRQFIRDLKFKNELNNDIDYIKRKQNLIFKKKLLIDEYIDITKISSKDMYSRALTMEYFLQNYI